MLSIDKDELCRASWYTIQCSTITDQHAKLTYYIKFMNHSNINYTLYLTNLIHVYSYTCSDVYNELKQYQPNMLLKNQYEIIQLIQSLICNTSTYTLDQPSLDHCIFYINKYINHIIHINWQFDCTLIGTQTIQSNFIKQYFMLPLIQLNSLLLYQHNSNNNNINQLINILSTTEYHTKSNDYQWDQQYHTLYTAVARHCMGDQYSHPHKYSTSNNHTNNNQHNSIADNSNSATVITDQKSDRITSNEYNNSLPSLELSTQSCGTRSIDNDKSDNTPTIHSTTTNHNPPYHSNTDTDIQSIMEHIEAPDELERKRQLEIILKQQKIKKKKKFV